MAVTVTDQRTEIDDADTVAMTGWASNSGETLGHFTADPAPFEGTGHIGIAVSEEIGDVHHAISSTDYSDHLIYVPVVAFGTQELTANGGITLLLGDGTDLIAYHIAGSDIAVFRHDSGVPAYMMMVVDTTNLPAGFEVVAGVEANLSVNALTIIGGQFEILSKALGGAENCFIDIIRVAPAGVGITIIGGTTGDRGTFAEVAAEDVSAGLGVIRELPGNAFGCQGVLTFGDSAGVTVHYFQDQDGAFTFEDRGLAADRYAINVIGNATGIGHFELGVKVGSGANASGSAGVIFKAPAAQGAEWDSSDVDLDVVLLYGCSLINFTTAVAFSADATNGPNHEVMGTNFQNCAQVVAGRAVFRGCTFDGYVGAEGGALLWNANIDVIRLVIQNCTEGIEHPTAGAFDYDRLLFSGNTFDINNSSNATNEVALAFAGVDATLDLDDTNNGGAQSFVVGGSDRQLSSMACELAAVGLPTGNVVMKIYSDAASLPDTLLATSDPIDVTTLGAAATIDFSFNDVDEQFLMLNGVTYWAAVEYSAGTATNYITVGTDAGGGLSGAHAILNGSWASGGTPDMPIEVRYDGIVTINALGGSNPTLVTNTGTPPGATVILNTVTILVGDVVANSQVAIYRESDNVELYNEEVVPTSRIWWERFETDPGYDEPWSQAESVGGASVLDEDQVTSGVTGAPDRWQDQCLRVETDPGFRTSIEQRFAADIDEAYVAVDFVIDTETLADLDEIGILWARNSGFNSIFNFRIRQESGVLRLRATFWHDDSPNNFTSDDVIALDTRYTLEVKWDQTNNLWEWRLTDFSRKADGALVGPVTQDSGSITSARVFRNFSIGQAEENAEGSGTNLSFLDRVAVDDTGWTYEQATLEDVSVPFNYPGSDVPVRVELRKSQLAPKYLDKSVPGTIESTGLSVNADQQLDETAAVP